MLSELLSSWGEKKYRIDQVNHAFFRELVSNFSEMTTLPQSLRDRLASEAVFSVLTPVKTIATHDTEKVLFKTVDGYAIESVLMRHRGRKTVCISSQVGCPAGCIFCATGKLGIKRNLTDREIYEQVLFWNRRLKEEWLNQGEMKNGQCTSGKGKRDISGDDDVEQGGFSPLKSDLPPSPPGQKKVWNPLNPPHEARVRNIVFMGMGEPLFNYEAVISAIKVLNDPKKFGIGVRHITISTVGIIPGIQKLMDEDLIVNLAVSLHAPTNELRSQLVPMNKTYPLPDLMKILDQYTKGTGKRIFYEYVVLKGLNDRAEDAKALGELLHLRMAHVNFIPYNVNPECGDELKKPEESAMRAMQKILEEYGVPSTIRMTMGDEMAAACGQLANKED